MATYSLVQSTGARSGGNSATGNFSSLPTAGNAIFVELGLGRSGGNDPTGGVSDNQGNTYHQAKTLRLNGSRAEIWYTWNIGSPSGTFTITCTNAGGGSGVTYFDALEFSGFGTNDPLFTTASASGGGPLTLNGATPTVNPDAVGISALKDEFAPIAGLTSGSPWSADFNLGNFKAAGAHAIFSVAGTPSVVWSANGGDTAVLAVFQDPADFAKVRTTQVTQSLVAQTTSPVRTTQTVQGLVAQDGSKLRTTQIVVTYLTRPTDLSSPMFSGRRGIYVPTRGVAGSEGGWGPLPFAALDTRRIIVPVQNRNIYVPPNAEGNT